MTTHFHQIIAKELRLADEQVARTIQLLEEGATIPFISRYRKERTGGLDEIQIGAIQERLEQLKEDTRTMIFYESPFRIVKTLEQFVETFGDTRQVSVSRELTKKFEETVRGTIAEVLEHFKEHEPKGEFVIVLAGKTQKETTVEKNNDNDSGREGT